MFNWPWLRVDFGPACTTSRLLDLWSKWLVHGIAEGWRSVGPPVSDSWLGKAFGVTNAGNLPFRPAVGGSLVTGLPVALC